MNYILLKTLVIAMLYSLFGDFSESTEPQQGATFKGVPLTNFLDSDFGGFINKKNVKGGGFVRRSPDDPFVQLLAGKGAASQFLAPLKNAGLNTQDYQFYADRAGITNVNSRSDLDQIIDAFEQDKRMPQAMSDEMVASPMTQQTMAGKYLGFF